MKPKDEADLDFGRYIRLRDTSVDDPRCISCGRPITYETCDCGHFIPRQHTSTRFDERNCNAQCRVCNRMKDGNLPGYTIGLVEKYGDKVISYLDIKRHNISKIGPTEYTVLIKHYQQEVKRLKEQKGL